MSAIAHLLIVSLLFALSATGVAQAPPIRIMPVGDSITDGSSFDSPDGTGGYRGPLYTALTQAGYNVDYVGSHTVNSGLLVEKEHDGHSGWRINQIDANIAGWFGQIADPDVILLHIGTNDFGGGTPDATAIDRLDALITKMATLRPYAHIIVTNLMERNGAPNVNIETQFNPFVEERVNAQAALGRRVTFLNMRAAVPLSDMPDGLHPDQTGYTKMAAAWLPAIQAVIGPEGDDLPPAISRVRGLTNRTQVEVTFSKPIADASAVAANFAINNGLTISAAQLDASKRVVTLTTSEQTLGSSYTVTVNGVQDRITPAPNTIAPDSTGNFTAARARGYLNNVAESSGYTLVYSLDLPNAADYRARPVPYTVDNRFAIGPFDRVAYYLELQQANGDLQYAWVSMDAFTANAALIGVPALATGAQFQQAVTNMTVDSNVAGVVNGTGLTGNLEFWPTNYATANTANVPNANGSTFDFGDSPTPGTYGSMQVHNAAAGQTIFAFNNWGGSTNAGDIDVGIGNDPAPVNNGFDWTFHHNGANYTVKTLQVLARTSGDNTRPTLTSASATPGRAKILVSFSEPLNPATVQAANFSLDQGVRVLGATIAANQRDVVLITTTQPAGTPLMLTVSNVRDSSPSANLIVAGSAIAVQPLGLPAEIAQHVGAAANGYQVVYSLDVPVAGNFNATNPYRVDDRGAFGTYTRIAYYMELQRPGGQVEYVWVSMDPFTQDRNKIGVPLASTGAVFQRAVTNMEVISNVAGVTNGTVATGGNIEFWPTDYSAPNGGNVPNASATTYDFGDTRSTSGGYGSMQVHNNGASQVVFALNRFGVDGNTLDIGIGNSTGAQPDYTFANNAGTFSRRVLHVLVLPGTLNPPALVNNVPEAANYRLVYSQNIPATGNLTSGTGFAPYSVDNRADVTAFSRVAYLMELQKTGDAQVNYVWVSMDAFTNNVSRIGIPNLASGATFQQTISNMNVFSNVPGVVTGTGITTGNIEFWPTNYDGVNAANVPNASGTVFDFGDRATAGNYGSMQVHNYGASQTVFALNHWGGANVNGPICIGIGNQPTGSPDWTFADNSASYDLRRVLQVYVLPGDPDTAGPTITRVRGSTTLDRLVVTFSEPVADTAAVPANFSIPGLTVTGATLLAGQREIALTTSAQTAGNDYTVNVTGVRDRSTNGNEVAAGANGTFTAHTTPAVLAGIPDAAGYSLMYHLQVPSVTPQWNVNAIPYLVDEAKYGERSFDRVAYCLELDGNWVYASFDPHTNLLSKIGVPTLSVSGTAFQRIVSRMNVDSNVASIVKGTDIATGNIEFWGGNYSAPNGLSIPNASATAFDFGDTMSSGGHGSMQIHNHGASQVVMAYNNWGNNVNGTSEIGIGNRPTGEPDWTFSNSASTFTSRNLYVLARVTGVPTGNAPVVYSHPVSRSVAANGTATFAVMANGAATYQWRKNGTPLPGETNSWLTIAGATAASAGTYDVVLAGPGGATTTSLPASLSYVNSAPTFSGYRITVTRNTSVSIARAALLAKAVDADGDVLSITGVSAVSTAGGSVTLDATNANYQPPSDHMGADSFTVSFTDGAGGNVTGTVEVSVSSLAAVPAGQVAFGFRGDGKFDVLFAGEAGKSYELQRSLDLTAGDNAPNGWTTIQTVVAGDDGLIPFLDNNPPTDKAYYRVKVPAP
jgi:lysophospholipase L1-like esterase